MYMKCIKFVLVSHSCLLQGGNAWWLCSRTLACPYQGCVAQAMHTSRARWTVNTCAASSMCICLVGATNQGRAGMLHVGCCPAGTRKDMCRRAGVQPLNICYGQCECLLAVQCMDTHAEASHQAEAWGCVITFNSFCSPAWLLSFQTSTSVRVWQDWPGGLEYDPRVGRSTADSDSNIAASPGFLICRQCTAAFTLLISKQKRNVSAINKLAWLL